MYIYVMYIIANWFIKSESPPEKKNREITFLHIKALLFTKKKVYSILWNNQPNTHFVVALFFQARALPRMLKLPIFLTITIFTITYSKIFVITNLMKNLCIFVAKNFEGTSIITFSRRCKRNFLQ